MPTETVHCDRAAQVLGHIQALLARHADCHRVRVTGGGVHLFTVDCNGDRVDA